VTNVLVRQQSKVNQGLLIACAVAVLTIGDYLFVLRNGHNVVSLAAVLTSPFLLALAIEDTQRRTLRRDVNTSVAGVAFLCVLGASMRSHHYGLLIHALELVVVALSVMVILHITSRGGLGVGDVRLIVPLALILSPFNFMALPLAIMLGTATAFVWFFIQTSRGKLTRSARIPLGTFLIIGTWLVVLVGPRVNTLVRS